jgi:hypothetical protein
MKIEIFVSDFLNEYISYREYYDDMTDLLDATIDNLVSSNTIEENKIIINDYCGDIFDAISLHSQYFPDENINSTKDLFYERLSFISMFVKLFPIISDYVNSYNWNEKLFIKEFTLEYSGKINSYDEITDILDSTINEYVLTNTYESNKEIIIKYYGNIESAIIIYNSVIGILQYSTIEYIYSQLAFLSIFINIYPKIIDSIIST